MRRPTAHGLKRFHATMTGVWLLLGIPTVLWWKDSIAWVAFMSLYANAVGHFSGYDAARAEANQDGTNQQEN